jgi:hypothetical protein
VCLEIDKCRFAAEEVAVLEYTVSGYIVSFDLGNIDDTMNWPRPTSENIVQYLLQLGKF